MNRPDDERLLTRTEAAHLLGVSVRTIDRLAAEGALPRRGRGRLVRYRTADVRAALDRRQGEQP